MKPTARKGSLSKESDRRANSVTESKRTAKGEAGATQAKNARQERKARSGFQEEEIQD